MTENDIASIVVDAALKIHRALGPGLLESVYEVSLAYELHNRGLPVVRQRGIPVIYEEIRLDLGFCADLIVDGKVINEIKSVEILAVEILAPGLNRSRPVRYAVRQAS